VSYNLTAFDHIKVDFFMERMPRLLHAVAAVETINYHSPVLILGPRTESDIMILKGFGFIDIMALDLISYSPLIKLGDMHSIPFADNSFEVVICGWTLSYSTTPQRVVDEMLRVVSNGGLLAFGIEHTQASAGLVAHKHIIDERSLCPEDDRERINTCTDLLSLLGPSAKHVYFNHDAPLRGLDPSELTARTGLGSSQVMLVVGVQK